MNQLLEHLINNYNVWAWQYDRPEQGEGLVQAFRREESPYEVARFKLRGLEPAARYAVTNLDRPESVQQLTGRELMEHGLAIVLTGQRSSGLFLYRRLDQAGIPREGPSQ